MAIYQPENSGDEVSSLFLFFFFLEESLVIALLFFFFEVLEISVVFSSWTCATFVFLLFLLGIDVLVGASLFFFAMSLRVVERLRSEIHSVPRQRKVFFAVVGIAGTVVFFFFFRGFRATCVSYVLITPPFFFQPSLLGKDYRKDPANPPPLFPFF